MQLKKREELPIIVPNEKLLTLLHLTQTLKFVLKNEHAMSIFSEQLLFCRSQTCIITECAHTTLSLLSQPAATCMS